MKTQEQQIAIQKTAEAIARDVQALGGRVLQVGGCVRDAILGCPCDDIDSEVYGISAEALCKVLARYGDVDDRGQRYGVYMLKKLQMDFALPRREKRMGPGHKDFAVTVDPMMSPEQAAARRDFTVNAVMRDVLTGEWIDPYGGRKDLEQGILRAVPSIGFEEDALRVFRAAQFAARFELNPDEETVMRMRRMDVRTLSASRVYTELKKALLEAKQPSRFFEVLVQAQAMTPWFDELDALHGKCQNPVYHPEGDAWMHTMAVLDEAAKVRDEVQHPLTFMLACLVHDLGKGVSTRLNEQGEWTAEEHEKTGLPLVTEMMERMGVPAVSTKFSKSACALHMDLHTAYYQKKSEAETNKLLDRAENAEDLVKLVICDARSTGRMEQAEDEADFLQTRRMAYQKIVEAGFPTATQLMAFGVKKGPQMRKALASARMLVLEGADVEGACKIAAQQIQNRS